MDGAHKKMMHPRLVRRRAKYSKEAGSGDPETRCQCIVAQAPYPSSFGGVYQPVRTGRQAPQPQDQTQRHCRTRALTVLFMNLHEGFVRLLCSGEIVLVLEKQATTSLTHSDRPLTKRWGQR